MLTTVNNNGYKALFLGNYKQFKERCTEILFTAK